MSFMRRAIWHANRTKLAWVLKGVLSMVHRREKTARRVSGESHPRVAERIAQLRRDGYATVTDLVDARLLEEMGAAAAERLLRAEGLAGRQTMTHKAFWVRLLDGELDEGRFSTSNVFVRFALQPALVDLVSNYLGEVPILTDVLLTLSRDSDAPLTYSQLWHRDFDDVHTLKVFTYLTDVCDAGDGPFTLLPGPASDRVGFTLKSHLEDEKLFARADRSALTQVFGARLTTFICETSRCMHMGSRVAPGRSRLMYTASYISAPNVYPGVTPRFCPEGTLTQRERMLLGLPEGDRR